MWIYGRAELRVCALGVRIHLAHGRESVFRCIPLYLVLYRVGTLYLDAMPRIRLYLHRTCCILIVSDGFLTRAPRYIRNTSKYSGIHQDTVFIENPPTFHRKPPQTPLRGSRARGADVPRSFPGLFTSREGASYPEYLTPPSKPPCSISQYLTVSHSIS